MSDLGLSPRHADIVKLVGGEGLTYAAAATELEISEHTVRSHVRVICERHKKWDGCKPRSFLTYLHYVANGHGRSRGDPTG